MDIDYLYSGTLHMEVLEIEVTMQNNGFLGITCILSEICGFRLDWLSVLVYATT